MLVVKFCESSIKKKVHNSCVSSIITESILHEVGTILLYENHAEHFHVLIEISNEMASRVGKKIQLKRNLHFCFFF